MENTRSLTPIIGEDEFLPLVEGSCQDMLSVLKVLEEEDMIVNKLYYFTLLQEAEKLEGFLDDHGARYNARWLYFGELVACVRNFSLAGFHLYHLLDRYSDYLRGDSDQLSREFRDKSYDTLEYFSNVLLRFYHALLEEAAAQGISLSLTSLSTRDWHLSVTPQLPYTVVSSEETRNEDERLISIAQSYRKVVKSFRQQRLDRKIKAQSLTEVIPSRISETMMTQYELQLHNIQSEYDTYTRGGRLEKESDDSKALRGLTAIPMHLFEALRWLAHFFERHENEIRKSDVKVKISELARDDRLLNCILDFGLKFCARYMAEGNRVAEAILSSYVKPITYELPIPKPQGFHARPATYVSLIVQEHGTDVFIHIGEEKFDCRSVLDIIQAGGMLADTEASTAFFEGDKRVLDDIKILADHNYCEDQEIPQALSYIRILRNL